MTALDLAILRTANAIALGEFEGDPSWPFGVLRSLQRRNEVAAVLQQKSHVLERRLVGGRPGTETPIVGDLCLSMDVCQEFVDLVPAEPLKQGDDQAGEGVDLGVVAVGDRFAGMHPDLSCVSQPGEDAESPVGGTSPATERGAVR